MKLIMSFFAEQLYLRNVALEEAADVFQIAT